QWLTLDFRQRKYSEAPVHQLPYHSVYMRFLDRVAAHPSKPVFELPNGSNITYGKLFKTTQSIAAVLHSAGMSAGDRVVVQVEKSPQAIAAYQSTLQVGGIYVPLNTDYNAAELQYFLDDAEPTVVIVDPAREQQTRKLAPNSAIRTLDRHGNGSLLQAETPDRKSTRLNSSHVSNSYDDFC